MVMLLPERVGAVVSETVTVKVQVSVLTLSAASMAAGAALSDAVAVTVYDPMGKKIKC